MKRNFRKNAALVLVIVFFAFTLASCSISAEKDTAVTLEAQRAQFEQSTQNRRLDEVDGVMPASEVSTDGGLMISADYPEVEANESVKAELAQYVDSEKNAFREEAESMGEPSEDTGLYNFTLTYKPYVAGEILSVKFTENSYTGRTDKKNYVNSFVYDLTSGARIGLADVFDAGQDYLTPLSATVRDYLSRNGMVSSHMDEQAFNNGTAPNEQNYSNFALTGDGKIVFFFNEGAVAAKEAGAVEVCVPLSEFEGVLNENALPLLTGEGGDAGLTKMAADEAYPDEGYADVVANAQTGADDAGGAVMDSSNPAGPGDLDVPQLHIEGNFIEPQSLDGIDPLNDKVIAFTFDDGPSAYTDKLLDCLRDNGAKATFFIVGERVSSYPESLKRAYDEGHEIANHSWDHPSPFMDLSKDQQLQQYSKTNDAIEAVIGKRTAIDRPPGGSMTEERAAEIGREQILWSVDTLDWKLRKEDNGVDLIYNAIMDSEDGAKDGSIILLHDLHEKSVDAAIRAIPELKEQGYKFVTISQMMQIAKARGKDVSAYLFGSNTVSKPQ